MKPDFDIQHDSNGDASLLGSGLEIVDCVGRIDSNAELHLSGQFRDHTRSLRSDGWISNHQIFAGVGHHFRFTGFRDSQTYGSCRDLFASHEDRFMRLRVRPEL